MGAQSTAIQYQILQDIDTSTISGTYLPIGDPLSLPARIIKIVNTSTVPVTISTDGINPMDIVPAGGFTLYDLGTNKGGSSPVLEFAQGTQFMAAGTAGTGLVYLVALSGVNAIFASTV